MIHDGVVSVNLNIHCVYELPVLVVIPKKTTVFGEFHSILIDWLKRIVY